MQCLYPDGDNTECAENDASVAVKISYHAIDFLFTGDLEAEGENRLVSRYGSALQSEVLKLGHHGSKTSSTQLFLDMVQPRWAVASVGEKNRYGHPSKEVVSRLVKDHITLFRTDKQGAVFFETDGKTVLSKTFLN